LFIIGRMLAHSQPQTTNRYAHVDGDPALFAIDMIGETIDRGRPSASPATPTSYDRLATNDELQSTG
jgi:hypothetical protein